LHEENDSLKYADSRKIIILINPEQINLEMSAKISEKNGSRIFYLFT